MLSDGSLRQNSRFQHLAFRRIIPSKQPVPKENPNALLKDGAVLLRSF